MEAVFPKDPTVAGLILGQLAAAGNSLALRTPRGFRSAAERAIRNLRSRGGAASSRAAGELDALLEDTELLDTYRASLLES